MTVQVRLKILENDLEVAQAYAKLLHAQLQDTARMVAGIEAEMARLEDT